MLDPVGGATLQSALEPLAKPSGAHDHRERPQRLHDALIELTTHGGKQKVAMNVTASIETLLDLVGAPGAENEFSLPISSKTVERWACDCSLTRVLLQDSVVIDIGRAERTIKGPRRRALMARDQTASGRGVTGRRAGAMDITSCIGCTAVAERSKTRSFCAAGIIGWFMKAGGS